MKVVALFSGYYLPHTGGVERYIYNISKKLNEKGYKVILVSTKYSDELAYNEDLGYAKIYRLPIYKLFSHRYPIIKRNKEYKNIINKLRNENIESIILNTRFQLTSLCGAEFAKKNNIPACIIEHGSSHFTVYNPVLDFFGHIYEHLLTNKMKDLVKDFYGVSKAACSWLNHYNITAKGVLYNAVDSLDYIKYSQVKDNNKRNIEILFAGRLLKDKGILLLVEAFKKLKEKYNNISLSIAGDGPLYDEIKKHKEYINLLGKLNHEQMMSQLSKTDIFVNPSYTEGMPTSVLEAGLMKCAVVATPVGGTREIITDNKTGIFCETNVESIKEKIEFLINNKDIRIKMSDMLHEEIKEKFSWENTSKGLIKYRNL